MRKTGSFVLACILLLSVALAGCSSSNQGSGEEGSGPSSGDNVTINVFAHQSSDTNLQTNKFTKKMEEKFNVKINWTTVPFDGAAEKRQISLASGDYPDLYLLIPWVDRFSQTDLLKFGQQGVIVPLNDLIEQYAPNIKKVLDSSEYYKAMNTAPDGNIYGLTGLNECFHCSYPNKMWMNTKWLEQLGLSEPTTTEEFKEVLKAFKTKDPNGNGKADEVPLSGSIENFGVHIIPYLMNGFIYDDDRTYLIAKEGRVDTVANKPEWKEGLAYIKSLYDEGLIDPGAFTQNVGAFKKIGDNADAQLLGAGAAMHPSLFVNTAEGAPYGKDYNPIPPLKGPHANYATYNYPIDPGASFVLTNKASEETQIAAIKMLDYLYTQEGAMSAYLGEEGTSWRKPEEGDIALNDQVEPLYKAIPLPTGEEPRNDSWGALSQYNHHRAYRDAEVQGKDIYAGDGYERRLYEATLLMEGKEPQEVFPHWALWVDPANADETSMMQTNLKDYIDQNALQFITGAKDLEKDWDDYVKGLEALNIKRYLEIMQAAYDSSSISK
ncbi:ABC transporter substrate-binding protein [Paenibacillus illinoisensis]|uniref:Family 1 extracellular solute-binding protein n=1 Tax=Paenibacillus illinoisensis TaxID=59845 RepID=A0A2W0CQ08_9BACL|nr:ABC transporter substrate-binding protein [Paenibacillus illinoisensis]PYY25741.1 Family 1 extracellular solute-binding protein [Paenibacillus illinoisensis]